MSYEEFLEWREENLEDLMDEYIEKRNADFEKYVLREYKEDTGKELL